MRLVIQRSAHASVSVGSDYRREISRGLTILVGVEVGDTADDVDFVARKTSTLRIFDDDEGVMNRSVVDVAGELLAVSQFTLLASTRKGNRPSYIRSAKGDEASALYDLYCSRLQQLTGIEVKKGIFGADMLVEIANDGPVTIIIDSRLKE
ncbi:MAG: D-tyrosyl-tRNA(Tyr) deacylase [Muribaculaceae bacterium]|nr:D-tyrosyl-tRNA(Tyr) deacylase [Muribaculaceae bacterium]